jgi:hypothetical protein
MFMLDRSTRDLLTDQEVSAYFQNLLPPELPFFKIDLRKNDYFGGELKFKEPVEIIVNK